MQRSENTAGRMDMNLASLSSSTTALSAPLCLPPARPPNGSTDDSSRAERREGEPSRRGAYSQRAMRCVGGYPWYARGVCARLSSYYCIARSHPSCAQRPHLPPPRPYPHIYTIPHYMEVSWGWWRVPQKRHACCAATHNTRMVAAGVSTGRGRRAGSPARPRTT